MNLAKLFHGFSYAVVGGVATRAYMPERFTKDIDVLLPPETIDAAQARLLENGWHELHSLHFPQAGLMLRGTAWGNGLEELDLLTSDASWVNEAVASAVDDASGIAIVSLPFLLLMKLEASRVQDTSDIARMLALADDKTIARAREVIHCYSSDSLALEDFDSLLEIGRWELEQRS